jgi:hypothetical protein
MTVNEALELVRRLKYGPLPRPSLPTPSLEEAVRLIRQSRRDCGFNWLTGIEAEKVICAQIYERK